MIIYFAVFVVSFVVLSLVVVGVLWVMNHFLDSTWFCTQMLWHKHPIHIHEAFGYRVGVCPRCHTVLTEVEDGVWY